MHLHVDNCGNFHPKRDLISGLRIDISRLVIWSDTLAENGQGNVYPEAQAFRVG